jgi:uncharacterized protein YukE
MSNRAMIADLEALSHFISRLQDFNTQLSESSGNLTSCWSSLGETWQDAQYEKFASEWEQALQTIRTYLNSAPEYVNHLQTKARQVSDYLES